MLECVAAVPRCVEVSDRGGEQSGKGNKRGEEKKGRKTERWMEQEMCIRRAVDRRGKKKHELGG